MKLSVVIVNYNARYYLSQCIRSLLSALKGIAVEIIWVDNGSTDGSLSYISSHHPHLRIVYNAKNVGFSRAANQGILQTTGKYILLISPDTVVPENTIRQSIEFMDTHPEAGITGVQQLTDDGNLTPDSSRKFPGFLTMSGMIWSSHQKKENKSSSAISEPSKTGCVSGAFMLIRRDALRITGLLDERFFIFWEDYDLSYRMQKAGYQTYNLPCLLLHYHVKNTDRNKVKYISIAHLSCFRFISKYKNEYNFLKRLLLYIQLLLHFILRIFSLPLYRLIRLIGHDKNKEPCLLYLGSRTTAHDLDIICSWHKFSEPHNFVYTRTLAGMIRAAKINLSQRKYTHIVCDTDQHPIGDIIKLLLECKEYKVKLGLINSKEKVLVMSENCYIG